MGVEPCRVIAGIISIVLYERRDEIWRDVAHTSASTWALILYLPTLLSTGGFIVYLLMASRHDRARLDRARRHQEDTQRQAEIDERLLALDDMLIRLIPTLAPGAGVEETATRIIRGLLKDTTEVFPRKVYRAYILRPDADGTALVPWIGYQMSEETMKRTRFEIAGGENPVAQQLREATPFEQRPRYLIRDNDSKFGPAFARVAATSGIEVVRTAYEMPRMNALCEGFLGSVRRERLDHLLILGEVHLRRALREYVRYFNELRPHQGIQQRIPAPSGLAQQTHGTVRAIPILGGLHHDDQRVA